MSNSQPHTHQAPLAGKTMHPQQALPGKKVLIVQQVFKQYRLAFFQQLAAQLANSGIELTLCFSLPQGADVAKADNILIPPAPYARLVRLKTFGPLVWQAVPDIASFDLVIVEQANRHSLNYLLLLRRQPLLRWLWQKSPKVIFWGHGFNHQAAPGFWANCKQLFKKWLLSYADGFFAYTQQVANYAIQQGITADRITVLQNSIDTTALQARVQQLRVSGRAQGKDKFTLLYCGALYPDKNIPLLLETARYLVQHQLISKLIVLGDGPDRPLITAELARQNTATESLGGTSSAGHSPIWLDYRGACFGEDKAAAYAEADLVLNPGLVGLAILDAFAAGLPLVTTPFAGHSPEISYLQHGVNGLMVEASQLPVALKQLLQAPSQLQQLAAGAAQSSAQYSLTAMIGAFAGGVCQHLSERP